MWLGFLFAAIKSGTIAPRRYNHDKVIDVHRSVMIDIAGSS